MLQYAGIFTLCYLQILVFSTIQILAVLIFQCTFSHCLQFMIHFLLHTNHLLMTSNGKYLIHPEVNIQATSPYDIMKMFRQRLGDCMEDYADSKQDRSNFCRLMTVYVSFDMPTSLLIIIDYYYYYY